MTFRGGGFKTLNSLIQEHLINFGYVAPNKSFFKIIYIMERIRSKGGRIKNLRTGEALAIHQLMLELYLKVTFSTIYTSMALMSFSSVL